MRIFALLATGLLTSVHSAAPAEAAGIKACFQGLASFYADKFHGRRTASGETYDQNKLTCAHRYLPFGTRLLVRNPGNGTTCIVRVNDRGPFKPDRILDLSKAAAHKLGIRGVEKVTCSPADPTDQIAQSAQFAAAAEHDSTSRNQPKHSVPIGIAIADSSFDSEYTLTAAQF